MKADLHYHGPLGFQPYWLKVQGYEGKNLLEEIADVCFEKELDICAITSEEKEIPRNSIHDRLNYLTNFISSLPKEYKADKLGKNAMAVEKQRKKIYLLNSQTVLIFEKGKRIEHLVVGNNEVPNFMPLKDALKFGKDYGLIQVVEHPLCEVHGGMGKKLMKNHIEDYDAIEGHNSQLVWGWPFSWLPVFGSFAKNLNGRTQKVAEECKKPWIATSDAHQIEDAGLSYIKFEKEIDTSSDETIIKGLREIIISNDFENVCNYESYSSWINWVSKFVWGIKFHKDELGIE